MSEMCPSPSVVGLSFTKCTDGQVGTADAGEVRRLCSALPVSREGTLWPPGGLVRGFCAQRVGGGAWKMLRFACDSLSPGHLDDDGLPHGFCTVTYSSTDRFEGNFVHGEKNGRGKFFFFDGR